MAKRKKSYTAAPEIPEALLERYRVMLEVLSGATTVSEGARRLGLSRNHFQTLMHQALEGLIQGLTPRPPGKTPRSELEKQLLEENEALRRENERLGDRTDGIERMLGVASELLRSGRRLTTRASSRERTGRKGSKKTDEEPPERRLELARKARTMGLTMVLVAALMGLSTATLRRWARRDARREALVQRRGPSAPAVAVAVEHEVNDLVRRTRGLVGADALRRSVPGVSRRQAAAIKKRTLTAMERERIAAVSRVTVTVPGVVRGFDAMHLATTDGPHFVLAAGDGSIPYRTTATVVVAYDAPAVAAVLADDFARHGAPLVLRLDRAKAHQTPEILALAQEHGVLLLHGPPCCPRFYGQLERQNREHRAWLDANGLVPAASLQGCCDEMVAALNGLWRRPTLGFRTAEELWLERPKLEIDRTALREEVLERTERIQRSMTVPGTVGDLAWRLAIEQTLTKKGLLRREAGGWC